jgi:hypothetical protein
LFQTPAIRERRRAYPADAERLEAVGIGRY